MIYNSGLFLYEKFVLLVSSFKNQLTNHTPWNLLLQMSILHFTVHTSSLTFDKSVDFFFDYRTDTAERKISSSAGSSISNGTGNRSRKSFKLTKISDNQQEQKAREDALNAANDILKNVKEMRNGVDSKTIQKKIKESNNRKPMVENFRWEKKIVVFDILMVLVLLKKHEKDIMGHLLQEPTVFECFYVKYA